MSDAVPRDDLQRLLPSHQLRPCQFTHKHRRVYMTIVAVALSRAMTAVRDLPCLFGKTLIDALKLPT